MTGSPNEAQEARRLLLSCGCKALAETLSDPQIAFTIASPRTHKDHPLRRLIKAASDLTAAAAEVLFNTERAIRLIRAADDSALRTWLDRRMAETSGTDFERSASALGEIRAVGALIEAGGRCRPMMPDSEPTPDLRVDLDQDSFFVEVHTKQMNAEEAQRLHDFLGGREGRSWSRDRVVVREHVVSPAGKPKDLGETIGENVASKFAAIKPKAPQAREGHANILWIDLQDEDSGPYWPEAVLPVIVASDAFFSSGLWHAFYGTKNTPVFENHAISPGFHQAVRPLGFAGMFAQTTAWSAVVLSFPRHTVVFEHPNPSVRLPAAVWPMILRLPVLQLHLSVIDWPGRDGGIRATIERTRRRLNMIAEVVRSGWEVTVEPDRKN